MLSKHTLFDHVTLSRNVKNHNNKIKAWWTLHYRASLSRILLIYKFPWFCNVIQYILAERYLIITTNFMNLTRSIKQWILSNNIKCNQWGSVRKQVFLNNIISSHCSETICKYESHCINNLDFITQILNINSSVFY